MYRIVFGGVLLNGFEMEAVRRAAMERLKLSEALCQHLFSGRRVVVKKAVSAASAQRYLAELNRIGMAATLEPLPAVREGDTTFKVVFWGQTLEGFAREQVIQAASRRLRLGAAQAQQLFSGAKAVLKRGLTAENGARYVTELARIGMRIELEQEVEQREPSAAAPVVPAPAGTATPQPAASEASAPPVASEVEEPMQVLKTQLNLQDVTMSWVMGTQYGAEVGDDDSPPPDAVWVAAPVQKKEPPPLAPVPMHTNAGAPETVMVPDQEAVAYYRCPLCGRRQPVSKRRCSCGCEMPNPNVVAQALVQAQGRTGADTVARAQEPETPADEVAGNRPAWRAILAYGFATVAVLVGVWVLAGR